jgi:hypothetical protein
MNEHKRCFAMKKPALILALISLLITGCTSGELTREEAFRLIQQSKLYPQVTSYDIYTGDPQQAKKLIDAGLERAGLITVQRTQKLSKGGNPFIRFTDKAQSYFLPTPESDRSSNIQKVKLADEELVEVTGIKTGQSEERVVVEYTTAYKNLTPFAVLVTPDFKKHSTRRANFSLYDDGWRMEK